MCGNNQTYVHNLHHNTVQKNNNHYVLLPLYKTNINLHTLLLPGKTKLIHGKITRNYKFITIALSQIALTYFICDQSVQWGHSLLCRIFSTIISCSKNK